MLQVCAKVTSDSDDIEFVPDQEKFDENDVTDSDEELLKSDIKMMQNLEILNIGNLVMNRVAPVGRLVKTVNVINKLKTLVEILKNMTVGTNLNYQEESQQTHECPENEEIEC
ncbi:hypothetical protein FQR65_LT02124 [Abscondita terminalis]|nr:hypothetical protein FQR65_LT02124 [Abscondita terminalis]